jgi:hypothetical protein
MGWARRAVLLFAGCIGAVLLGIALSIALARPAGAATLPAPTPAVPAAVDTATAPPVTGALPGLVGSPVAIPNAITGVTAAAGGGVPPVPTVPLPGQLPVPKLPSPQVTTLPVPHTATPILPAAAVGAPGTGGPAHAPKAEPSSIGHAGPAGHRSAHPLPAAPASPVPAPAHELPSPSFPLGSGLAGNGSLTPGHGNGLGNAIALMVLLLAAAGIGSVFLRRRLSPPPLFDSRFAPPG